MFTIDWNDPQMFWLNVTNVLLVLVTLACAGIVGYAAVKEILVRLRARMPILLREPHLAHMPELGMTMADGGEPMPRKQPKKSSSFRKTR
jgi:hypothetical protein